MRNQDKAQLFKNERMLSVRETAQIMGWCLDSVRRHLRAGDMPGVKVGRNWRIPESQLAVYMGLKKGDAIAENSFTSLTNLQEVKSQENSIAIETLHATDVLDASLENQREVVSVLLQTQAARAQVRELVWSAMKTTHASYEVMQAGSQEPVYVLDHGGARVLSLKHGQVSARAPSRLPKALALDHLLGIIQMRVCLTSTSSPGGFELLDWLPGDKVRFRVSVEAPGQRRQQVSIVPDAGLVLRAASLRHYAFLEVDRGTEAGRILTAKGLAYGAYWRSGGFARDFGGR